VAVDRVTAKMDGSSNASDEAEGEGRKLPTFIAEEAAAEDDVTGIGGTAGKEGSDRSRSETESMAGEEVDVNEDEDDEEEVPAAPAREAEAEAEAGVGVPAAATRHGQR
jgi:hypothetical protein